MKNEKKEKYSYNKGRITKLMLASAMFIGGLSAMSTGKAQASTDIPVEGNPNVKLTSSSEQLVKPIATDKVKVVSSGATTLALETSSLTSIENVEFPILVRFLNENDLTNVKFSLIESHTLGSRMSEESTLIEFDVPKLAAGEIGIEESLLFKQSGIVKLKGVIKADGVIMETEWLTLNVVKHLVKIPNVVLPNVHNLPVATLKANESIKTYKKESNGAFVEEGVLKTGSLNSVYDVDGQYYKLKDNLYVDSNSNIRLHISRGEVRENGKTAYDKNGKVIRVLKKGQKYNIYSYTDTMYNIGGGEYIKRELGIAMVQGTITLTENANLLTKDGKFSRALKKGETYKVYSADDKYIQLGGGLKIDNNPSKFKFNKF